MGGKDPPPVDPELELQTKARNKRLKAGLASSARSRQGGLLEFLSSMGPGGRSGSGLINLSDTLGSK